MSKFYLLILLIVATVCASAQAPQYLNYQAVIRNNSGNIVANQAVAVKLSIHNTSATGTVLYTETHTQTTNQFGLFTALIGNGTNTSGNFININWGTGAKYLQVAVDVTGGTNYVDMGTTQLMSVPYALYAAKTTESQTLSINNNTLSISSGNTVALPANNDNSATNELQTLSLNGNVLSISNGNSVTFPTALNVQSPNGTIYTITVNDSGVFNTTAQCNPAVTQANAGADQLSIQGDSTTLLANNPTIGTGMWSIINGTGGTLANANQFNTKFYGVTGQNYILRWTVSNTCGSTYDDINVSFSAVQLPFCNCQGQTLYVFPSDNSSNILWAQEGVTLVGPQGQSPNDGEQNTNAIIATYGATSPSAAQLCANITAYGYDDWYLPSKDELYCMYQNIIVLGNNFNSAAPSPLNYHAHDHYWSSTEYNAQKAWVCKFGSGVLLEEGKIYDYLEDSPNVRCVRKNP